MFESKSFLDQDEIDAFVRVLQLPHVLPIQGPYAIKLLKAVSAETKTKCGDSKALKKAADALMDSYESFVSNLDPSSADDAIEDLLLTSTLATQDLAQSTLIHSLQCIFVKMIKIFVLKIGQSDQMFTLTDVLLTLFIRAGIFEGLSTASRNYAKAIVDYMEDVFHPTVTIRDHATLLPDHPKAPLPIEHVLIKTERGSDDYFATPEAAQAVYNRAMMIGYALRSALLIAANIDARDGQDVSIEFYKFSEVTSTAFDLLCRAALRSKQDYNADDDYRWDPISPPSKFRPFDFNNEYEYYSKCWKVRPGWETCPKENCSWCHEKGAEAFLAPALHMLGCSQVAAVGNRAWPAVYKDEKNFTGTEKFEYVLTVNDPSQGQPSNNPNCFAILFGRTFLLDDGKVLYRCSNSEVVNTPDSTVPAPALFILDAAACRPDLEECHRYLRFDPENVDCSDILRIEFCGTALRFYQQDDDEPYHSPHSLVYVFIPQNLGKIYLSGMPECDEILTLRKHAKSIANDFFIDQKDTESWIIDILTSQIEQGSFICNCPAWYRSMIERTDQHFEPAYDCRAFKPFTGDHGQVTGCLGHTPVTIYYSRNDNGFWTFYGESGTPGSIHIISSGTWTNPDTDTTYNYYIISYYFPVNSDPSVSTNKSVPSLAKLEVHGNDLAKRLLQVAGLDMIDYSQLLVECTHSPLEKFKDCSDIRTFPTERSWNRVSWVVAVIEWNLVSFNPVALSLQNGKLLVAAPVYIKPRHIFSCSALPTPSVHVMPLLVWALTGHYCELWDNTRVQFQQEDSWIIATMRLLPKSLRPNSGTTVHSYCQTAINAMLNTCNDAARHTLAAKLLSALTTNLNPELVVLFDAICYYLERDSHSLPTLDPSQAVLWVHLVFCVMHGASLSDLASHPLLASPEERLDLLKKAGQCMHDDIKTCATGHLIHKKLWQEIEEDKISSVFDENSPKLHAYVEDLTEKHPKFTYAVPLILVRHRLVHADPDTDAAKYCYPKQQIKEIYGKSKLKTPEKFLRFFGARFPALELVAWLVYTTTPICLKTMRLANVAEATLNALITNDQVNDAMKAFTKWKKDADKVKEAAKKAKRERRKNAAEAAELSRLTVDLEYKNNELGDIILVLMKLSADESHKCMKLLFETCEHCSKITDLTDLTSHCDIASKIRSFMNSTINTLIAENETLNGKMVSDRKKYLSLSEVATKFELEPIDPNLVSVEYELLRLGIKLCSDRRDDRLAFVLEWIAIKSDAIAILCADGFIPSMLQKTELDMMQSWGRAIIDKINQDRINQDKVDPKTPKRKLSEQFIVAMTLAGPPGVLALARFVITLANKIDTGSQKAEFNKILNSTDSEHASSVDSVSVPATAETAPATAETAPATAETAPAVTTTKVMPPSGDAEAN